MRFVRQSNKCPEMRGQFQDLSSHAGAVGVVLVETVATVERSGRESPRLACGYRPQALLPCPDRRLLLLAICWEALVCFVQCIPRRCDPVPSQRTATDPMN